VAAFQTAPTFWLNRENGVRITSLCNAGISRGLTPGANEYAYYRRRSSGTQVLGNLAMVTPGVTPAVISHYNIQPVMDVYASVQGRDLGGVARDTRKIVADFQKKLPQGIAH